MSIDAQRPWVRFYDQGIPADMDIPNRSYTDALEEGLRAYPDRPAMHFFDKSFPFQFLEAHSRRFAAFLSHAGCGPGEVVGIHLPNIPQYLIALAGTLRAGCAASGISPLLTPQEMAYQLNDSGVRVLVTLDALLEHRIQPIREQLPRLTHVVATNIVDFLSPLKRILGKLLKKVPSGKIGPIPGKEIVTMKRLLQNTAPAMPEVKIDPADTCLVQYTGGTTGMPKGAVLTHANIMANLTQSNQWLDFQSGKDIACSGFPFFHLAGLGICLSFMANANAQCLIPDPRNTKHICGQIARHRPTMMANVPSLYQMLLEEPAFKALDFSPLRVCVSGAAPFPVEGIRQLESVVGSGKVVEVYGMTETGPLMTMNPLAGKKKIGTVGIPIQNTRIKIVDIETGSKEMAPGEEGEIIAHGPQVMKGYHNKPKETAHTLRTHEGQTWMFTGDVGRMDEEGYLTIVDRAKDMLIVGGYKVFSKEVEDTLYKLPAVEICAIIGVPNQERPGNDIVKAVIQVSAEAKAKEIEALKKEITEYCRKTMAPYKVPKIIEVVDQVPLTPVGKVDKKALRR